MRFKEPLFEEKWMILDREYYRRSKKELTWLETVDILEAE